MSFDLYLHASEDQTRKIAPDIVDRALLVLPSVKAVSKKEYACELPGARVELEVEHETAHGGDVKGIYVHVASGSGMAAFEKAKELSLALVDALQLVIYDHQAGSYVAREAFAAAPIPEDGVMFRVAGPAPVYEAPREAAAPAAASGGGCAGLLIIGAAGLLAALALIHI